MKQPRLVQRCELGDGMKLRYDYMGNAWFEFGAPQKSMKRIFAAGTTTGAASIYVRGTEVRVFMVGPTNFPFAEYQPHLQQIATNQVHLEELTDFDTAVKEAAGIETRRLQPETNVWFDIENDVLWTLNESAQRELVATLGAIKEKWVAKAAAE